MRCQRGLDDPKERCNSDPFLKAVSLRCSIARCNLNAASAKRQSKRPFESYKENILSNGLRQWFGILPVGISFEEVEPVFCRGAGITVNAWALSLRSGNTHPKPAVWYAVHEKTAAFSLAV